MVGAAIGAALTGPSPPPNRDTRVLQQFAGPVEWGRLYGWHAPANRVFVWYGCKKCELLWPAATLFLLLIVVALIFFYRDRVIGCDVMEPGGTLYLRHEAVDTVRGRFCYASDCRLIAELMSEVERASWYCYQRLPKCRVAFAVLAEEAGRRLRGAPTGPPRGPPACAAGPPCC